MLRKKEVYTQITPIPSYIPRQLALDILQSHSEIITLNPLVLDHKAVSAPRDAEADEFYATWYELTERIQYIPGAGRMGSGKITFKGCFHDMPWGLQSHIYAPAGVDMRCSYRIDGNQPGEPPKPRELGIKAPPDGLYLREDIEIKCNIALVSFVKSQMRASSKTLVDRFIKKAELLDAGVLQAMMQNGRMKTINPADRSSATLIQQSQQQQSQQHPPSHSISQQAYHVPGLSPLPDKAGLYNPHQHMTLAPYGQYQQHQQHQHGAIMELPGDYYHQQVSPTPSYLQPHQSPDTRPVSTISAYSSGSHGSTYNPSYANQQLPEKQHQANFKPTMYHPERTSLSVPQHNYVAELPVTQETHEEHNSHHKVMRDKSAAT